ncbi:MAG: hypothetical protein H6828_14425 [Planctomycetes bacterium]|nr:hypothetical protein [Planctomycetota bacterium]
MVRLLSARSIGSLTVAGLLGLGTFALVGRDAQGVGTSANLPLPTTLVDFFQPGTQENTLVANPLQDALNCRICHGNYDPSTAPYDQWVGSMMAQATRDPMFHAALAIANQDASFAGDLCLRCHTPKGWLQGHSVPTDGSALDANAGEYDGVTCHVCHRMVDPVYDANANPIEDQAILAALVPQMGAQPDSAQYVIDPDDNRRGPFDLGPGFFWHNFRQSPFHQESLQCGTCHDVSNPAFTRQQDGTYALNAVNTPHPTHDKRDKFPVERTFSEWSASQFAVEAIEMGGRFGGNKTAVASCQDCHMPDTSGGACAPGYGPIQRNDLPMHKFTGGNTWVLRAIDDLYPDWETNLTPAIIEDAITENLGMLANAADLETWFRGSNLVVRVVNQTGHKLPTGYPEGRRMWLNVKLFSRGGALLQEYGHYDVPSATLTTGNTTVFEAKLGMDAAVATAAGLTAGESFHFVLNNTVVKDNRIPPRGFTAAAFDAVQSPPVGETFMEEQYWHDSTFALVPGTHRAVVTLYYQTTSKEYAEFLRDTNLDQQNPNNPGQVAYDKWVQFGKSAPAQMASAQAVREASQCAEPIQYGVSSTTSGGSKVVLAPVGLPMVSAANFKLNVSGGPANAFGIIYQGTETASVPYMGGTRLVGGTLSRLTTVHLTPAGGTQVPVPLNGAQVGSDLYFQVWLRDIGLPQGVALSNGLRIDVCN